ncbi:hypothetical protein [Oceanirhabdus seepicola]|uniref:Serine acetyltransferase n=1 Tax=Oceanirhabdus seepicola TaxID=2828781 RepID=A0A9J6P1A0_9CLOT|nr:hypothetical protein [Oceanirhabdus seepicola]MCM1990506.1 hypothetical protein [Oceanirhabdus seepicola]
MLYVFTECLFFVTKRITNYFLLYNIIIPYETEIGKGTKFGYDGMGAVIHKNVVIGNECFKS